MTSKISSSADPKQGVSAPAAGHADHESLIDHERCADHDGRTDHERSADHTDYAQRAFQSRGFLTRQRELFKRRLWPAALTFLCYFLYHVVGIATIVLVVMQESSAGHRSAAQKAAEVTLALQDMLAQNDFTAVMLVFPLAVILAIEGFAWMDNRREVDFYESQPVPRLQRFLDICVSSFLYFLFSYVITLEAGLLIAGAAGALTRSLLLGIVWQSLRSAAFFLAIHGLGVLAAMLTGNVIVALLAFFVLLFFETECKAVFSGYCSQFFDCWSGRSQDVFPISLFDPFSHYLNKAGAEGPLRLLALAVLYFLLAWICCRLRKNECAGSAVVFGPVRTIVRIALSALAGLIVGLFFASLQNSTPVAILWMVLFTVIGACIMEIIYEYDFRALFRHPLEIAVAVALTLLFYLGFLFDVTGYDRFLPEPDKVADAALISREIHDTMYDENGRIIDAVDFGEKYMHLDNVEDVISIARYGQEFTRKKNALKGAGGTIEVEKIHTPTGDAGNTDRTTDPDVAGAPAVDTIVNPGETQTWSFTVLYRMKSGKTIARSFQLPASMDPAVMDAVTGTQQYREGAFPVFHDASVRGREEDFLMDYTNGITYASARMTPEKYDAFRRAYLRDLAQFNFSFARENLPVGKMHLTYDLLHASPDHPDLDGMTISCPVYAPFTNTLTFLQANGLWLEPVDYSAMPRREDGNLSAKDRELLDSFDYWSIRGPFSPDPDWY